MRINDSGAELIRAELTRGVRATEGSSGGKDPVQPVPAVERADTVQISDAGRVLASRAEAPEAGEAASLSPDRIDAVRRRILEGAYDSVQVVDEVAKRMLQSGDI